MSTDTRNGIVRLITIVLCSLLLSAVSLLAPPAIAASNAHDGNGKDHPRPTTGCYREAPVTPGVTTTQSLTSEGTKRTYELHLPTKYDPAEELPVILAFHGRKGTGKELEEFSGLSKLNAIVAYPNGLPVGGKTAWAGAPYAPPTDDVQFVTDLLDNLQDDLCVDSDRIFATGKSNGGGFTALLACQLPHRIAAFAPVAGAFYPQSTKGCDRGRGMPVPMIEFHGTGDPIIEYGGGESHGENFPAIQDWIQRWADRGHCRSTSTQSIGEDVVAFTRNDCAGHVEVVHYRIADAGHTWPGELANSGPGSATQTISATHVMWEFFLTHPLHPKVSTLGRLCRDSAAAGPAR